MDRTYPRNDSIKMARKRTSDRVRYGYKTPTLGRATFSIYEDVLKVDGTRQCRIVTDERLRAVNDSFRKGVQNLEACKAQVKEIVADLYKKDDRCRKVRIVHSQENQNVLDEYWDKVYAFRTLENEASTRHELNRVIDTLGPLSIYSASREQLQTVIDQKVSGNVQRRMVARLTQILKFIGRNDVKLRKARPEYNKVEHLSEVEFMKVISIVQDAPMRDLMTVCFYSGLRIAEAYALKANHLVGDNKDTIRVVSQVDRNGVLKPSTKTKKPRLAFLLPPGLDAFHRWVQTSDAEKAKIRRISVARIVKTYCQKVFPNEPEKQITFHALRHSYAILLLTKGVSMSLVAQSLGNSLSVCQHYYVGFELTNETVAVIRSIVSAKS